MPKTVHLKNGTILHLQDKAAGGGGEGEVYKVISPVEYRNQVAKVYFPAKRTSERENKIQFLASNPPTIQSNNDHCSVIWVKQTVYENGKFCGYTMPLAKGVDLKTFLNEVWWKKKAGDEWNKLKIDSPSGLEMRLKICFNLAAAIYQIHFTNKYVLVDLKPDNVMIQPNGLVSLIDIDSIAVISQSKVIFSAPVTTPDYTPPEYYKGLKISKDGLSETWDRFSMAVIFYRLLCNIHPFTGTCMPPYEQCERNEDMIKDGLFPNGSKNFYFKVIPNPHSKFKLLKPEIQKLFQDCFDKGHNNPNVRPSADDWCRGLSQQSIQSNFQTKRCFPSGEVFFPVVDYSKALVYNPSISLEIPVYTFTYIEGQNSFLILFQKIFGKSKRQLQFESFITAENELKTMFESFKSFSLDLQGIINKFREDQTKIISSEKQKIDNIRNVFKVIVSDFDNKAKGLHLQELNELKQLTDVFTKDNNEIEKEIQQKHFYYIGKRKEDYENLKLQLQNKHLSLVNQEQSEIRSSINNPFKLQSYKIQNASIQLLTYSNVLELAAVGINTAADIVDVDSSKGSIKDRKGNWVKAKGVGGHRAVSLQYWKRNVEVKENDTISQQVKQKYKSQIFSVESTIKDMELLFQNEIKILETNYFQKKLKLESEKVMLKEIYDNSYSVITRKYTRLNLEFTQNAKDYADTILLKLKSISDETQNELDDNFKKQISKFATKKEEIKVYTETVNQKIDLLYSLKQELN